MAEFEKTVTLTADAQPLVKSLVEIDRLLEATELSREVRERALRLLESGEQLVRVHVNGRAATGTEEFHLLLEPSDGLRDVGAALRTGNGNFDVVEHAPSSPAGPVLSSGKEAAHGDV